MYRKYNTGFSLLELMICLLIATFIIGAMLALSVAGRKSWQIGSACIELYQELRKGMDWITQELREAGYSTITNVPADGLWYNTINFRKPEDVIGSKLIWGSDEIQYLLGGLNNKQLLRKVGSDNKVLANNITSFLLRRTPLTPDMVEVALQGNKTTIKGNNLESKMTFVVQVRN